MWSMTESRTLVAGTVREICSASLTRKTITFFPASASYVVAPQGVTPSATVGWLISTTSAPFMISLDVHGDVVTRPWSARSAAGTTPIIIQGHDHDSSRTPPA